MAWTSPNLTDFTAFVQNFVGISDLVLPTDSPFLGYAFDQAMATVIRVPGMGPDYTLAVYNCATHILFKIAPDQSGRTYFEERRTDYNLLKLSAGVIQSASDESTSESIAVPDAIKQLTIGDLGFMRTPWGRDYLSFAQDFGGLFGLS